MVRSSSSCSPLQPPTPSEVHRPCPCSRCKPHAAARHRSPPFGRRGAPCACHQIVSFNAFPPDSWVVRLGHQTSEPGIQYTQAVSNAVGQMFGDRGVEERRHSRCRSPLPPRLAQCAVRGTPGRAVACAQLGAHPRDVRDRESWRARGGR